MIQLLEFNVVLYSNSENFGSVSIPEHSKILDIYHDGNSGNFKILIDGDPNNQKKDIFIKFVSEELINNSINNSLIIDYGYKYFNKIDIVNYINEINVNGGSGFNINTIANKETYFLFIDENITLGEIRSEKLNNILNG